MPWLLFLLACPSETGPAPSGSRSAALAQRAADVGQRAAVLAERTRTLEGLFDELRAAPPEGREPVRAQIQAISAELQLEARAIRDEVAAIEEAAQVY